MTQVEEYDDFAPTHLPDRRVAHRLLLRPVRLPRNGPADPVNRIDGRTRDGLADHLDQFGSRPLGGPWLIDALDDIRLTGHGGGHFPAARKWRAAMSAPGPVWVVGNGAESEPLSGKDATLLRQRPHLVLDGLASAAETLGATRAVVWLHDTDRTTRLVVDDAIRERRAEGFVEPWMVVVTGKTSYLSGESSAVAHALAGGDVLPTFRGFGPRRRPGPNGQLTLVNNVETLARVALAARAYRPDVGSDSHNVRPQGTTTLLTILTPLGRHVAEVSSGSRLGDALSLARWPDDVAPVAVLLGGFGGMWMRWDSARDLPANEPAMRAAGATLGAGIVAPISQFACGVAETAQILAYLAASSARQCGPCLFGLDALADGVERLRTGFGRRSELRRISADLQTIRGRGACHHPDGAVRLLASALETFGDDFGRHVRGRPCAYADSTTIPVPVVG